MSATVTEAPVTAPAPEPADPAAPFGRFSNGKPRKSPKGSAAKKSAGAARAAAPRASTRRSAPKAPDYRPGIMGLFQTVTLPLAFAAPADAAAVSTYAPGIAEAVNDLARERPEVAAALERVMQVGPYGALIGAVVPLAVQLLHNHDLIPEKIATTVGATPKRTILAQLRQQAEHAQAHADDDGVLRDFPRQHPADRPSPADMPRPSHAVAL